MVGASSVGVASVATAGDSIKELSLSSNKVVGSIPNYVSAFGGLQFLDLADNGLQGTLPVLFSNVKCVLWGRT